MTSQCVKSLIKDEVVSYNAKLFYEIVFNVVQTAHHDS